MAVIYGREVEAKVASYVRPELWPFGARLQPSDWPAASFYLPTGGSIVKEIAVNVTVTGRTLAMKAGAFWVRCKIEFVGDGEPSQFSPGWMLVE